MPLSGAGRVRPNLVTITSPAETIKLRLHEANIPTPEAARCSLRNHNFIQIPTRFSYCVCRSVREDARRSGGATTPDCRAGDQMPRSPTLGQSGPRVLHLIPEAIMRTRGTLIQCLDILRQNSTAVGGWNYPAPCVQQRPTMLQALLQQSGCLCKCCTRSHSQG